MKDKIETLFDCIKTLCESDLDRIISFVLGIVSVSQEPTERPNCPYCGGNHILKNGHKDGKQRFLCKDCGHTFSYTTNTLMKNSHYGRSIWADFIRDTLYGESLDKSAEKFDFSHQTAFNMRHKVLMALEDMARQEPILLSGVVEFDETFALDCYKGAPVPESAGRRARKHGAKASKRGISNEYVAICTCIQRDGGAFNLNTVNGLHSFIKDTYNHYRGVATKYINRYNALFSVAFCCAGSFKDTLFASLCTVGSKSYWHGVKDIRNHLLVTI